MKELFEISKIKDMLDDTIVKKGYRYLKYVNRNNEEIKVTRKITRESEKRLRLGIPNNIGFSAGDIVEITHPSESELRIRKLK